MAGANSSPSHLVRSQTGRAFWLPPVGVDNDINATAWAPILEADRNTALSLIRALGAEAIPAFTAPTFPLRELTCSPGPWRIWVDSERYSSAESVLMRARAARSPTRQSSIPSRHSHRSRDRALRWLSHSGGGHRDA